MVLSHNKTLAAQLYGEFKHFFPENAVEYFVSYYDYYQPEAYVPSRDLYIEKDATTNDEIDEMRHSATASLLERDDVIVVASVSCIYGIGNPEDYKNSMLTVRVGDVIGRDQLLTRLIDMLFTRNDYDFSRGSFRVKGDVIEILPTYSKSIGVRIELFDDEIERIREFDILTGEVITEYSVISIFPATQFITNKDKLEEGIKRIEDELEERLKYYKEQDKYLEAERIQQRTNYDIEMLKEVGVCNGVENYSRHLTLRNEGETPYTLMDFFGDDYLLIVDESHVTLPQVRGMFKGDRSRKQTLIDYGFRLPSALDNRPLNFEEFNEKISRVIYLSATPGDYELEKTPYLAEQIIRPTGLLDPVIEIRPATGQVDDVLHELNERTAKGERILITVLTKRMAEDLTDFLQEQNVRVRYLHSDIDTVERVEIIRDLRLGEFDVLVGINLLREGLDIPEVSLVAIFDADKEGFLRSERSLIQTIGRAARNLNGKAILYADRITDSMQKAIDETDRRREKQVEFNTKHGITPKGVMKSVEDILEATPAPGKKTHNRNGRSKQKVAENAADYNANDWQHLPAHKLGARVSEVEDQMFKAAKDLNFEEAARLRDLLHARLVSPNSKHFLKAQRRLLSSRATLLP